MANPSEVFNQQVENMRTWLSQLKSPVVVMQPVIKLAHRLAKSKKLATCMFYLQAFKHSYRDAVETGGISLTQRDADDLQVMLERAAYPAGLKVHRAAAAS